VVLGGIFTSAFLNMIAIPALYFKSTAELRQLLPHIIIRKESTFLRKLLF
jgi:hypothetical protein